MQVVILLILVTLLGYVFKSEKSTYSRMIIGSVFGIVFFAIWPLISYYLELHKLSEIYRFSSFSIIALISILLSYLCVITQYKHLTAGILLSLFVVINIITFSFQSDIKNFIAINSNYFSNSLPDTALNSQTNRTTLSNHNYTYTLTGDWNKKTDKGSVFEYYELYKDNVKQVEFRPRCFSANNSALSEIVNSLITSVESRKHSAISKCYEVGQSNYACRIDSFSSKEIIRTQWLRIDSQIKYGMELDFVIFNQHPSITREINTIIQSALFNIADPKELNCLGLTEWL